METSSSEVTSQLRLRESAHLSRYSCYFIYFSSPFDNVPLFIKKIKDIRTYLFYSFYMQFVNSGMAMEERNVDLDSGAEPHERHEMLASDENSSEINIRFDDLCYSVPEGKGKGKY